MIKFAVHYDDRIIVSTYSGKVVKDDFDKLLREALPKRINSMQQAATV